MSWIQLAGLLAAASSSGGLLPTIVTVVGNRRKARQIDQVVHEVKPNGGASMRDAVGRIEKCMTELSARVAALEERRVPFWRR